MELFLEAHAEQEVSHGSSCPTPQSNRQEGVDVSDCAFVIRFNRHLAVVMRQLV